MTDSSKVVQLHDSATTHQSNPVTSPKDEKSIPVEHQSESTPLYYWGTYPGDYLD